MAQTPPELLTHREWLGQIEPVGLVVSPNVLVRQDVFVERQRSIEVQTKLGALVGDDADPHVRDALRFFREILEWPESAIAGSPSGPPIPDSLVAALPEYEDHIRPDYGLADPDAPAEWLLLIQVTSAADLDAKPTEGEQDGWRGSPHARLERLLRETGVSTGILFNRTSLRLVYAPKHESSGHLTFKFKYLLETQGRPMAGALAALLGVERVTDVGAPAQRLSQLLKESRKSQNDVSTALAGQVLEALWELVRGFQHANEASKGQLLEHAMREAPNEVYGGLLTTLMRLVFVLYAEDRGLMPAGPVYQRSYSVAGLFERLREDAARYPDTMDARYGAWAQLLALFRLIHDGGRHGSLRFTARHGRLFSPDAYPFLEGRPHGTLRSKGERVDPPRVSDGVVFRVLRSLLLLDSERLSYRALDVEQIGSVYEAMMGFALEQAPGPSVAISPKHIVININDLLEQKGSERGKWLREQAELKLPSADAVSKAKTVDDVIAALGKKISRYTPNVLPVGALYLQPTEERRRSGSHYTPRSLTEPIVRTTFRPIFERLGPQATPEQILDLKVCDPAMGSGAFLVEACRLLSDRLVQAWDVHKQTPKVPDDEDVHTYARRQVAERCLYGVDKNVFAVDLAKLSLWLATLAREHPFTFLDHALRHGDSLVGLSREQIACFNWEVKAQMPLLRALIDQRVTEAQRLREQIQGLATSDDVPRKEYLLRDAEDAVADVRLIADLIISAFVGGEATKERRSLLAAYGGKLEHWLGGAETGSFQARAALNVVGTTLRENTRPISPFHWQIEFPEVFTRSDPGFDVFVGNPPFAGVTTLAKSVGSRYTEWLRQQFAGAHGKCDVVAFFFRSVHEQVREGGAVGLLATKTIAQGDTRTSGLVPLLSKRAWIFEAEKRIPWPGDAEVIASRVHFQKGGKRQSSILNGKPVDVINSFLLPSAEREISPLASNKGLVFLGAKPGSGAFLLSSAERQSILETIPESEWEVIRRYLVTSSIYGDPASTDERWAFALGLFTDEQARRYPAALECLRRRLAPKGVSSSDRWWRFSRPAVALNESLRRQGRSQVIVKGEVSDTFAFVFADSNVVFSNKIVVWVSDSPSLFCVLQSQIHEVWARLTSSTFGDGMSYVPSDSFETFPLPIRPSEDVMLAHCTAFLRIRTAALDEAGAGLTTMYGRFDDPEYMTPAINALREAHRDLDRTVLDAYGWTDIDPTSDFFLDYEAAEEDNGVSSNAKQKPYRYRWPDGLRDEVLARLLALNAARAEEERLPVARSSKASARRSRRDHQDRPTLRLF